ncbi:hypothetical protein WJX73_001123 [Symbiochloris irregularis]|uniref:ATP-dependent RNA helicase n=1 Tax=Symbiochloris irregularis TaxID=706552 RepID=A0AAW1NR92_9CHLO
MQTALQPAIDTARERKTLAFLVPLIEKLRGLDSPLKKHQVGAVVVSPTRELARQTYTVLQPFLEDAPELEANLLVGGRDPLADVTTLQESRASVLVGTPGRLFDVLERCEFLDFKHLELLILDEADRVLDMGFRGHIDAIMARLPKQRRTGLFSATQTDAVEQLARAGLRNPVRVNVAVSAATAPDAANSTPDDPEAARSADAVAAAGTTVAGSTAGQRTPTSLQISYMLCEPDQKMGQLIRFLQAHRQEKVIVYMLTCACVDFWASVLHTLPAASDLVVHALHGRMKQRVRDAKLAAFTAPGPGCLLCTDIAARGLDIPDVSWTVQVDAPQDPDAFVHRVGRSARMGRPGRGLILLAPSEQPYVKFLLVRKVPVQEQAGVQGVPEVDNDSLLAAVRAASEGDRDVMEKGTRAFVSYVRAYREHQCRFIFRMEELDLGRLAMAFGLLRLPRMPELARSKAITNFTPSSVDLDAIKYKDKTPQARQNKRGGL